MRRRTTTLAQKKEYYARNRDIIRARVKAYTQANPEKVAEAYRQWRLKNPERARELSRAWAIANPGKIRASHARYFAKHPEAKARAVERTRIWIAANSEKMREYFRSAAASRRALQKQTVCTLTRAAWLEILEVFDHRCAYCLRRSDDLQQEHVWPLSRGGDYTSENIVPACPSCNARKHARGPLALVA